MSAIFASDENISYFDEQNLEVCSLPWIIGLLTRTDYLGLRAEAHYSGCQNSVEAPAGPPAGQAGLGNKFVLSDMT